MTYDIVFSFDTTGSMSTCINLVRKSIKELTERLFNEIPEIKIGIVAHGDYCDEGSTYLMKYMDLTTDKKKLVEFVEKVENTSGGDYPEAYEYVLKKVQDLSWTSTTVRSLVIIGDAPPHEKNKNPHKIDWREEVDELHKMGINIYSVQALYSGKGESYTFYKQMATKTNGYHLFLDQFSYISNIMMALCYKQISDDRVIEYEQEISKSEYGLTKSMRNMFDTLLKRKVTVDMVDDYDPDDDKITACPPAKYQMLTVDDTCSIKDFVEKNRLTFKTGKGFYEFTKPETISEKKAIVLMDKRSGELFEGKKARKICNFDEKKKYKPSDLKDYIIFVQSTSYNRNLVKDTRFLYEALDYGFH